METRVDPAEDWSGVLGSPVADALRGDGWPVSVVQRMVLTTDGTLTQALEAYAGEPVGVVKLSHLVGATGPADVDLGLGPLDNVLTRTVLLCGRQSHTTLVYAVSSIAIDRLPDEFARRLASTDEPIGKLLVEYRTETFRELLRFGKGPAGERAPYFDVAPQDEVYWRSYRMWAGGQPVMLITESFPITAFR